MKAMWLATVAAGLSAAACISRKDYNGSTPDAGDDAGVDARVPFPACVGGGHDEDRDCVWDKPDMCPMVTEIPQGGDLDGDGVGDQCDPQHGKVNLLHFFDGFAFDSETGWLSDGTAFWKIEDDQMSVNLLGGAGGATLVNELHTPIRLVAEIVIDERGADAEVSLFAEYRSDRLRGSECFVKSSRDGLTGQVGWTEVDEGLRDNELITTADLASPMLGEGQRIRLTVDHGLLYDTNEHGYVGTRCEYTSGGQTISVVNANTLRGNGKLRLAARDVRLHVEWVAVYKLAD